MVEDAVEDDADAARLHAASTLERRVAAQHRIDLIVVVGVIAVVGGRLENRVEVDGVDAQVLQ